jgi:hypothetical protein
LYISWAGYNRNDHSSDNPLNSSTSVVRIFHLQTARFNNYHISALDEVSLSV